MMVGSGTVVGFEEGYLWVSTAEEGRCEGCSSRTVCCQEAFTLVPSKPGFIRIRLEDKNADHYPLGTHVEFEVSGSILVRMSVLQYFLPLTGLLFGSWLGWWLYQSDGLSALLGGFGFLFGGAIVRVLNTSLRDNNDIEPILLGRVASSEVPREIP